MTAPSTTSLPRAHQVRLTRHALERFRDRVIAGVGSLEIAEQTLRSQLGIRRASTAPPSWMRYHRDADAWLAVGRIALPLMYDSQRRRWSAVTCLHYDSMKLSDLELERRYGPRPVRL